MTFLTPVSLTDCDREPIHIPGSIQPHGVMLVCNPETGLIIHASANANTFFPENQQLIGSKLEDILGEDEAHDLRNASTKAGGAQVPGLLADIAVPGLSHRIDASMHQYLGHQFVEFQPVAAAGGAREAFEITHSLIMRLGRQSTLEATISMGAKLIRALLGYDRVMVYRMLHNGAGRVVAEAKNASLTSFLGQHFPPSDIPYQARRLYLLNTIRVIGNANYAPSPLWPPVAAGAAPVDMSYAQLRSVSPIHCEYLRNMGVAATMSISIVVDGELWGMIACHHNTPKIIAMPLRISAEIFGHYFSQHVALAERRAQTIAAAAARSELQKIAASLHPEKSVNDNLAGSLPKLSKLIPCSGSGLWIGGHWDRLGTVPTISEVEEIIALANRLADGRVWDTEDIQSHLGTAKSFGKSVAGVMAIPISSIPGDYLLLFRSEEAHNIEWAGEPTKIVGSLGARLSPRGSFSVWREEVRGRASPWSLQERAIAETMRDYMRDVVLRSKEVTADEQIRAEQRRRILNDELNHRVKNIIALVKSIAAQTGAHASSVDDYRVSLDGRLRALAYAHDQSLGVQPGDLSTLIEAEAALHRYASNPGRVQAAGPPIGLDDRAFSVLALIIHEMMTNAAKYGSLSVPDGQLNLSWTLSPDGDCILEWLETAGPPVLLPTREGFGGKLIRNTIVYDLGGEVSIEYRGTGLWARFKIPAARLTEAVAVHTPRPANEISDKLLLGKHVLVVEDQSLIAMDIEDMLRKLGAAEVRCVPNIAEAREALAMPAPDFAILDFNLGEHTSAVIADQLLAMNVQFIFVTGYGDTLMIPERFGRVPTLCKPITTTALLEAFDHSK